LDPTLETPEAPVTPEQPEGDPAAPDQPDEIPGEESGDSDEGGQPDAPSGL
jgi:hypothetical protein